MKKLKYILIIFCFTLYYSCDSFLDVRPEGEVVNNELFKNAEGFEDAIYGVYSTLAGPSYYGRTMTYYFNDILAQYFFYDYPGDVRTVDVHVRRLREKIEASPSEPKYIHTKWGVGYFFQK